MVEFRLRAFPVIYPHNTDDPVAEKQVFHACVMECQFSRKCVGPGNLLDSLSFLEVLGESPHASETLSPLSPFSCAQELPENLVRPHAVAHFMRKPVVCC